MLTPALSVALTGDHGAAAPFTSQVTGCQSQIDQRRTVLDSFGLMFQAARVHGDGPVRLRKHVRRFLDGFRWNAGHLGSHSGIKACDRCLHSLKAAGVLLDKSVVL